MCRGQLSEVIIRPVIITIIVIVIIVIIIIIIIIIIITLFSLDFHILLQNNVKPIDVNCL